MVLIISDDISPPITRNVLSNKATITPESSLNEAWNEVLSEVRKATSEAQHPFRFVTLATVDKLNSPQQRMVVLRDFNGQSEFLIYSDSRSHKIGEILNNHSVSLLFYHPEKRLQLRVTGSAAIITSGDELQKLWEKYGSKSPHLYTSVLPPGTEISNPTEAYHWQSKEKAAFCLIKIEADKMEFLQLDRINHTRAVKIIQKDKKATRWIVP